MCILRLPLVTTKYDEQMINKRFLYIAHIHNVLVKHVKKQLAKLNRDKQYKADKSEYGKLKRKAKPEKEDKDRLNQLNAQMHEKITSLGLTSNDLEKYIKVCGKQFSKHLSSQQVQKEAARVYAGVEKVLYSDGKDVHFKRSFDFHTISGKSNTNGIKFDKETHTAVWNGLELVCKLPDETKKSKKSKSKLLYINEALKYDISYCEIERKMFNNGWHYYLIIYLKDDAPKRLKIVGNAYNVTGVDIGTSTVATVSEDMVMLEELAPDCQIYNKQIVELQRHMDISKRLSNPDNYNEDGTVKKSKKKKWLFSETYFKNRRKVKTLYRKKSAYIKQSHEEIINHLLKDSTAFVVENMAFKALQKKSKKTERSEKQTEVKSKNGTVKKVNKYKCKKRFGRSLNNRAPASFITILTRKAKAYNGCVIKVDTFKFKASQYDHIADTYTKSTIDKRDKIIGGNYVQRDLYSAFLLKNSDSSYIKADKDKCEQGFDHYLEMQNDLIETMKANNISMKQCFGF